MTKQLAPIEELAESLYIYSESHYDSINDTDYTEYTLTKYQFEQLRQAIIRDFVSTLEPVAWCDAGGHLWWECQRKHFPQTTDKPLYDLSEWSNK